MAGHVGAVGGIRAAGHQIRRLGEHAGAAGRFAGGGRHSGFAGSMGRVGRVGGHGGVRGLPTAAGKHGHDQDQGKCKDTRFFH